MKIISAPTDIETETQEEELIPIVAPLHLLKEGKGADATPEMAAIAFTLSHVLSELPPQASSAWSLAARLESVSQRL